MEFYLARGTQTQYGVIANMTFTGYLMEDGSFAAFQKLHGKCAPEAPLVPEMYLQLELVKGA